MTQPEECFASIDDGLGCELEPGHDGPHMITWEQDPPPPPRPQPPADIPTGYLAYLIRRFGG